MPNKNFHNWLNTVREPSGKLYNILAQICASYDLDPTEITRELFLSQKGAGIRSWGEFVGLIKGLDNKLLYDTTINTRSLEIEIGSLWEVKGVIYELYDIRVTEIQSHTEFKILVSFQSKSTGSLNPTFREEVQKVLSEPDIYRPYKDNLESPKHPKTLPGRIYYTVGNSNKKKWFNISQTLAKFKRTKDGKNYSDYSYPFKASFNRFISRRIKGINALSDGEYAILEELFKKKYL